LPPSRLKSISFDELQSQDQYAEVEAIVAHKNKHKNITSKFAGKITA
jgi:hypothetical protein